jgi:hypothetical protein
VPQATAGLTARSHPHVRRYLGVRLRSNAIYLLQFLDPTEPSVLLPPRENRLCGDWSDPGQFLELGLIRTVQINCRPDRRRVRARARAGLFSYLPGWITCRADHHLLAIVQELGKV